MPVLGPGTLKIGPEGSEIDASCLVNNARIAADKDEGDSKTMLCGTQKAGKVTYTYSLSGSFDTDADKPDGLFALSQSQPGSEQPFTFTPDTAAGTAASGTLILDPLDFGADEYGDPLDSDFEFSLVGPPAYTYGTDEQVSAFAASTPAAEPVKSFPPIVINGRQTGGVSYDVATTLKAKTKTAEPATASA